jgi:hypothetical protein
LPADKKLRAFFSQVEAQWHKRAHFDVREVRNQLLDMYRRHWLPSSQALIAASAPGDALRTRILQDIGLVDASGMGRHPNFQLLEGSPPNQSRRLFSDYDFTSACVQLRPAFYLSSVYRHFEKGTGIHKLGLQQLRALHAFWEESTLIQRFKERGFHPVATPLRITVPELDVVVWRDLTGQRLANGKLTPGQLFQLKVLDEEFAPPPDVSVKTLLGKSGTQLFMLMGHLGKVIRFVRHQHALEQALDEQHPKRHTMLQWLLDLQVLLNKIAYKLLDIRRDDKRLQAKYRALYPLLKGRAKMHDIVLPQQNSPQAVRHTLRRHLRQDAERLKAIIRDVASRTREDCAREFRKFRVEGRREPPQVRNTALLSQRIGLLEYMARYLGLLDQWYNQGLRDILIFEFPQQRPWTWLPGRLRRMLEQGATHLPRPLAVKLFQGSCYKLVNLLNETARQLREAARGPQPA